MHFSVRTSEAKRISMLVRSTRGNQISVRYLPADRFAYSIVVPKRQGNAVKRNRAKRILREIMRLHSTSIPSGLYLVYVNRPCSTLMASTLDAELMTLIARAHSRQTGFMNGNKPNKTS